MRKHKEKDSSYSPIGCLLFTTLVVLLTPLAGIFLITKNDPDKKMWGWFLLVAGLILWIIYACIFGN